MAKNDDLSAQATLEQSINDSIAQRAGLLKQMNAEMSAQLQMQLEICKACESGPDYSEQASQMGELNDALSAGADSANKGASAQSALGKAAGGAGDGRKAGGGRPAPCGCGRGGGRRRGGGPAGI